MNQTDLKNKNALLLISDGYPAANGGGISQTLYNLLEGWPGKCFFVARPREQPVAGPILNTTTIYYRFERHHLSWSKHFLKVFDKLAVIANFNYQQQLQQLPSGLPLPEDAFVLVSTTEPIKLHFAWMLQERFGYTVVPYFMDDWMADSKLAWKDNSINRVAADLLQKAPCRLMISRKLDETLVKRYGPGRKPTLIVHNPAPSLKEAVDTTNTIDILPRSQDGLRTIVYAGSIWPMHFDALQVVARAVQLLNKNCQTELAWPAGRPAGLSKYRLVIYTSVAAWQHNRRHLEGPGVEYGGFIPYNHMPTKLAAGWLLLVTASFLPRYAPFTNSSVQTKLTDYMAAGKPVLFVGPLDGASGEFVHEWDCGYTIGTNKPEDIAAQLEAIAAMPKADSRKAANGLAAAGGYFSKPVVQQRFYDFLEQYVGVSIGLASNSFGCPGWLSAGANLPEA